MAARPAHPDRYTVDRIGTPDPSASAYYVLDLVHDFDARVAVAGLIRHYEMRGFDQKAAQAKQALEETKEAHAAAIAERNRLAGVKEKKGAKQMAS